MTVLASDSFNRANNSTTLGTSDSYNGGTSYTWQTKNGTWGIYNNAAYVQNVTNPSYAYMDVGQSDVSISVTMPVYNDTQTIYFRLDPTGNTGLMFNGTGQKLMSFSGSTTTAIASVGTNIASGDIIKITAQGQNITVYRNGTQVLTATSTVNQTLTKHGIGNWRTSLTNGSQGQWDNFEIDDLNTGSTSIPLSSTVKSTSSATATPTLTGSSNTPVALSSNVKSSSSVTSAIKNTVAMVTSVKSNSSQTATVKSSVALGSTVKSNTSVTSNIVNRQALTSTVKSNSSTTNTVKDAVSLGSTNKSNTSATANISLRAQGSLSSVVKSNTTSTAKLSITKPLSSTVKSSSTSSGTLMNNKPISSTEKSSSSSSANLTVGFVYIISTTKSRTSSTATAQSSLSLITNVKSKTTSHASLSFYTNTGPVVIHKAVLLYGSRQLHENANGSRTLHEQLDGGV